MENRLLRNEHDKVIAGVSSGLAAYMEVDVTIIRLLFVLSTIFLVGTGILVYLVMWIVVPVNNDPAAKFSKFNDFFKQQTPPSGFNVPPFGQPNPFTSENATETKTGAGAGWQNPVDFKTLPKNNGTGRTVGGLFLLVIGLYFLMNEFDIIPYWFRLGKLWPLVFVAIGLSFILKSKRKNSWEEWKREQDEAMKKTEENTAYTAPADFTEKKPADFSQDLPKDEPKDQF
ncbi:MAG: PspC domain-containing protein [Pedobacter sp.]|jgi:phage shock protein C|uniref:PspC domain-containing protein n=1 Tax=Pedobacter sp. TaxID=1411316 RepID=UPI0033918049